MYFLYTSFLILKSSENPSGNRKRHYPPFLSFFLFCYFLVFDTQAINDVDFILPHSGSSSKSTSIYSMLVNPYSSRLCHVRNPVGLSHPVKHIYLLTQISPQVRFSHQSDALLLKFQKSFQIRIHIFRKKLFLNKFSHTNYLQGNLLSRLFTEEMFSYTRYSRAEIQ